MPRPEQPATVQRERHLSRLAVAALLVLHGLAHSGAGMWAGDLAPVWVVTPTWAVAMVGLVAAGFGVAGVPWLRGRWQAIAVVATASSIFLLMLFGNPVFIVGLAVDVVVLVIALGSREWLRARNTVDRAPRHRRPARFGQIAAFGFLVYLVALVLLRPWYMTWGTTEEERRTHLPGDELVPRANYRVDHAITIHAPVEAVWAWLVQIGQDRGGFYSYDWLENVIGAEIHNADRIVPAWQHRAIGDLVRAVPSDWLGGVFGREIGWRIAQIDPGRALVLKGWGAFVLEPIDARTTRMLIRLRGDGTPSISGAVLAPAGLLVFEPAHFIMERGMLLGIKERAERATGL